jgi:hypothetical protein
VQTVQRSVHCSNRSVQTVHRSVQSVSIVQSVPHSVLLQSVIISQNSA